MVKKMLAIRFLHFIFIVYTLVTDIVYGQLDDNILLPDLTIDLPLKQLQFSAQTGTTLQCDLQRDHKTPSIIFNVQWLVYSFLEQRFIQFDENNELIKQVNTINENYLSFLPFTSDQYNANLHNNFFRCLLKSSDRYQVAGQVVKIKALVSRTVEVHVYDQQTNLGDTAILRCVYPVELRSYVRVSGWLSDDGLIILPAATSTADPYLLVQRRYNVLSTGELLIAKVGERDANRRFRCQVINILTGERFESASWSRLTLTVRNTKPGLPQSNIADSTLAQPKSYFTVRPGDTLLLACLFTSHPAPVVTWQQYRIDTSNNRTFSKIYQANTGNLLLLPSVAVEDIVGGHYVCTANNSFGHARLELQLKLQTDLRIQVTSSLSTGQLDKSITLNCSYVYRGDKYKVIWYKNMEQLQIDGLEITNGHYETELNDEQSTITHWLRIRSFRYTDSGVYQCFLRSTSLQQQQRYPILSSITYNRPISVSIGSGSLQQSTAIDELTNRDQVFSNAIYLIVKEKEPKFISTFSEQLKLPSNELSLRCTAIGIPVPEIRFYANGFPLINSPRIHIETAQLDSQTTIAQLNISSLAISDGAFYECVAKNTVGSISNEARINVMGSPAINLHLLSQTNHRLNLTAVLGRSYTLHCPFYGYPFEKITFYKNDKKIVADDRRQERIAGRLIIGSIRREDEGEYKCIVTSVTGEKNEANMYLKVSSGPVSSAFEFPANLEEDMRTSLICSVTSGDSPIMMSWLRNNQLITSTDHTLNTQENDKLQFQIVSLNQFVSSLLINRLTTEYTANYTCTASNSIGTANHSTFLQVRSKTRFALKPLARQVAIIGEPVRFDCQAMGSPQPIIRWKYLGSSSLLDNHALVQLLDSRDKLEFSGANSAYLSGSTSVQSISILSNPRVHVLENGSLIIKQVQLEDEGSYLCEASNSIGKPVEAYAQLLVFQAPRVKMSFDFAKTISTLHSNRPTVLNYNSISNNMMNTISVKKGDQASFTCSATGALPINVEWTHNGILLPNTNTENIAISNLYTKDLMYSINEQLTNDQLKQSTLTIRMNARNASGLIRCQATNFFSNNVETGTEAAVKVLLLEPPGSPLLKYVASELSARSANIVWTIDYSGNSAITSYEIQYKHIFLTSKQQIDFSSRTKANQSLINQSSYGQSANLNISSSSSLNDQDQALFNKLKKESEDDEFWSHANVQFVSATEIQESNLQSNSLTKTNAQLIGQYNLNKLEPSTLYLIRIRAQNQLGFSLYSNVITVLTKKEAPSILPQNVTATSLNSRSIRVFWQIPRHLSFDKKQLQNSNSIGQRISHQLIEGFYVGYRISGSEETFNFITVPTNEQLVIESSNIKQSSDYLTFNYTLDQLRKSTKYIFVVQAFNSEGAGPYSTELLANTFNNDPPKPIHIRLESLSHHNVTIMWKKLTDPNQVQGFVLNYKQLIGVSELDQQQLFNNNVNPDQWETIKLPKFYRRYTLTNLNCGSKYLVHLIAYNEIGESEPGNELNFSTKGNLPIAPSRLAFIQSNITSALLHLTAFKDGDYPLSHFQIQYKQKNEFQWKFHSIIQVTNALSNNLPNVYQSGQHFRTEYHITSSNEFPIKTNINNIHQTSSDFTQISPSVTMASTYGQLVINDLQPGTWHDIQIEAYNQAGKITTNYVFSTLTMEGATVSPLVFDDQLSVAINSDFYMNFLFQYSSFTFIVVIFTLLIIISVYLLYVRTKLHQQSTIDQFSRHHQDTVSLNSYSNNKICSGLNIKSNTDIYDTRTLENNGQETCDNCDQTWIYATDPTALGRLAAQQIIPNFLSTTNLANKSTIENNYQESNDPNSLNNAMSNSLGALLQANNITTSNCRHSNNQPTEYDFVDPTANYCTNKNCAISNVLNKNEQMNMINNKMNCMNALQQTNMSTGCMMAIENRNSSHVYDIPIQQQQALNELQHLKQMSTFRNVDQF